VPLGYLSNLVATMPGWMSMAIRQDELDPNRAFFLVSSLPCLGG
jgi:hypothetical protein